jgi:outer membrane lipoprotein-sorting protein
LLLGVLAIGRESATAQEADPAAVVALRQLAERYAGLASYRDRGTGTTEIIDVKGQKQSVVRPFATLFVRPDRFRLDFTEPADSNGLPKRFVVWTNEGINRAYRWWTLKPEVDRDKLAMHLAGALTISGGVTGAVPDLLIPDLLRRSPLNDLREPRRLGPETVEGVPCQVIQALGFEPDQTVTLWIGAADGLLRKVVVSSRLGDISTVETLAYRPEANVAIPDDLFRGGS